MMENISCASMKVSVWMLLSMMMSLGLMVSPANGIACPDAVASLATCGPFLLGQERGGSKPSPQCCKNAQELSRRANDTVSRRDICECFHQHEPDVLPEKAKLLPSLCHLNPPSFTVDPTANCSSISMSLL